MKGSTSELLRDNCDEFIYYEDLERQEQDDQLVTELFADLPERKREAFILLIEACAALRRENHEVLYASMIKDTMKRKKPSFDESYYGYRSFTHLLEDADDNSVVDIERNPRSGTYMVTRFGPLEEGQEKTTRLTRARDAAAAAATTSAARHRREGRSRR